jgi:hypothetical protein
MSDNQCRVPHPAGAGLWDLSATDITFRLRYRWLLKDSEQDTEKQFPSVASHSRQAGIHLSSLHRICYGWMPAFAGMTNPVGSRHDEALFQQPVRWGTECDTQSESGNLQGTAYTLASKEIRNRSDTFNRCLKMKQPRRYANAAVSR